MKNGFADLHVHTYFSDSTSSPQEVVDDALKAGLSCIAITDHDIVEGVNPAIEAARGQALEVVPGIELSSEFENCDIHILGYFIDHQKGLLFEKIDVFLDARMERMKKMIMNLKGVGVDNIEFEEVCALTHSRAVGRAHLAILLEQKGWVPNIKSAFEKYIGWGRPAYVGPMGPGIEEAIKTIKAAGGPEAGNCVLLDDQRRITVAARRLGMYTILVGETIPGEEADAALLHLTDLPALIDGRI